MAGGAGNPMLRTATSSNPKQESESDQVTYCRRCNESFKNFDAFHKHKIESRKHVVCEICSNDFSTREALKQHHAQFHAAEQNLHCGKCQITFVRLAAFVAHIESGDCEAIAKGEFEQAIQTKKQWHNNYENARNFKDYGRSTGNFSEEPNPFAMANTTTPWDSTAWTIDQIQLGQAEQGNLTKQQSAMSSPLGRAPKNFVSVVKPQPTFENDNLLGFDIVSQVLNDSWDMPSATQPKFDAMANFPALSTRPLNVKNAPVTTPKLTTTKILNVKPGNVLGTVNKSFDMNDSTSAKPAVVSGPALGTVSPSPKAAISWDGWGPLAQSPPMKDSSVWDTKPATPNATADTATGTIANAWDARKLFPNAPPAVAPPTEWMQNLTVEPKDKSENLWDLLDPDGPDFNAKRFFITFTGKYKCPHKGCPKSIGGLSPFIAHLKSAAHKNAKLQCHLCLRYFNTATALTQHCESQGVRCKIRETDGYNGVVDEVTGGTGTTLGTHVDDTIKYGVNVEALTLGINNILDRQRKLKDDRDSKFNNYWDKKKTTW